MSTLQQDFDRIALVSPDGAAHNDHYHNFLLRHLPSNCHDVLEIGCGTGGFARLLARRSQHVLDLSGEMIRIAREHSAQFPNIEFELADVRDCFFSPLPCSPLTLFPTYPVPRLPVPRLPVPHLPFTLYPFPFPLVPYTYLPFPETLLKMKHALKPGGVLLVLDLFEPAGLSDSLLNLLAVPVSAALRLIHYGRLLPPREARAWAAHEHQDLYPTMSEVHAFCDELLPGARIKKHLLWRYLIVWQKAV